MEKRSIMALLLCALMGNSFASPAYIEFKPLSQVIKTPVANVSVGTHALPIITWGGDIATIYANGNQRKTNSGSIFAQKGLEFRLEREDVFSKQVENYLAGKTPYLRGTMGMLNSALDLLSKDARTVPVVFYQMTWSAGGDALVVKNGINSTKDLRGKTIAIQAYGPHVDYLVRALKDAGVGLSDVKIKWLPDLTGTDNAPGAAFYEKDVDAAFVITPDALALTSGGNVGTGSEDSVKGARILMSTKTANRVIADVYAVRADYLKANSGEVQALTKALMEAEESLAQLVSQRGTRDAEYNKVMRAAAEMLLDSSEALADIEGLYADCEFAHFNGNVAFFTDNKNPRRFSKLAEEASAGLAQLGLSSGSSMLTHAALDYRKLDSGLSKTQQSLASRFNESEVAALVTRKQQQNSLSEGELFSFEVFFQPNQNSFTVDLYRKDFDRVVELAATYGGAIITVEGHSDPMGFLRAKKQNSQNVVLGRIKQSARNLSLSRAQAVRDTIVDYAKQQGVALDSNQFAIVGHGIGQPKSGLCGGEPCPPKNEQEWRSNMRVEFRVIQIEAESNVFKPL